MKGDPKLIQALQDRLVEETAAIQQYSAHLARVENWGYAALVEYLTERRDDERKHQKLIMDRLEFFGIVPEVWTMGPVTVGQTVDVQLTFDREAELTAIARYNDTITLAVEVKDDDTRRLLETILADETDHVNDIEARLTQIDQIGLGLFLAQQI